MRTILVIDDELAKPAFAQEFCEAFAIDGFRFELVASMIEANRYLKGEPPSLVLLDIRFENRGDTYGLDLLRQLGKTMPRIPVVMMSSLTDADVLIRAWDLGALAYVVKRSNNPRFHEHLVEKVHRFARPEPAPTLVGDSGAIRQLRNLIESVASFDTIVLICGESGTGKELVAQELHRRSPRSDGPLITLNTAGLSESVVQSELFGHCKGAFTGADRDRKGAIESADGGVLFLDEIGDMPISLQALLLRFLEHGEYMRVGESKARRANVRVLAATNVDLPARIARSRFREDLFFRLNQFPIRTVPLRESKDDLPLLAMHFLELCKARKFKPITSFAPSVIDAFMRHNWPGNYRELRNTIERAYVLCHGAQIDLDSLGSSFVANSHSGSASISRGTLRGHMARAGWAKILAVCELEMNRGHNGLVSRVSSHLGLNKANGLHRKLEQLERELPDLVDDIKGLRHRLFERSKSS